MDGGEGGERHSGDVLHSHPEREAACGLIVEVLRHDDGRRAVRPVRFDVKQHGHVGLWHLTLLHVVGHPGVVQRRRGLDGLMEADRGTRSEVSWTNTDVLPRLSHNCMIDYYKTHSRSTSAAHEPPVVEGFHLFVLFTSSLCSDFTS